MKNDPLLQSFELKHLTLRNRIMSTAHTPNYLDGEHPGERYCQYHEEKSKGGLALTIFGGSSNVAVDSPSIWGQINLGNDAVLPHLSELARRIQKHGAAAMCQITHMGRRTVSNDGDWLPVIGPSNIRERLHRSFPKQMERDDIDRVIANFADAAERCHHAGLDGIELLAFGHLVGQFMTPSTNNRVDGYGGSPENRLRLLFEILDAIRSKVGEDFVVGLRMAGDELTEGGLSYSDCVGIAQKLDDSGLIDFLNINAGQPFTESGLALWMPSMNLGSAPHLDLAGRIKSEVTVPVFHAGAINDIATARHAIRDGVLDMVGMTRAHIADPYIVAKLACGEEDRIRPCVGTGLCVDRVGMGLDAICTHNVVTGREQILDHNIAVSLDKPKKIIVIGGGPGGMEAARVCAARGHRVSLYEASNRLGGQINLASRPDSRKQMQGIVDWLQIEIETLGVNIHYDVYAEEEDILAGSPDVIIVATGGLPNTELLSHGNEHLNSVWDVLSGEIQIGGNVLLYDDHGNHQGVSCAEYIASKGANLEFVTPDRFPGAELGHSNLPFYLRSLYDHEVKFTVNHRLTSVKKNVDCLEVELVNEYSNTRKVCSANMVVVEHGTLPMDDIYFDLKSRSTNLGQWDYAAMIDNKPQSKLANPDGEYQLFRIGDSVSSRDIHSAMYDAHRLTIHL